MVSLYKVTAEINGIQRSVEIVSKPEPNYFRLQRRIDKAFGVSPKNKINEKSIKFEMIRANLGL